MSRPDSAAVSEYFHLSAWAAFVLGDLAHEFVVKVSGGGEDTAAMMRSRSILLNQSSTWLSQDE